MSKRAKGQCAALRVYYVLVVLSFLFSFSKQNICASEDSGSTTNAALDIGKIVVTSDKAPSGYLGDSRDIEIIYSNEIKNQPVNSIPELLENIAGIDVGQRGPNGVQADIHVRGSGFNQVAILLNGVNVNDAQTGHHNMDIPVSLEDIDRIEIMRGRGSALYGPDAVSGVINIITKKPAERNIVINMSSGKFKTGSIGFRTESAGNVISVKQSESGGHRPDTDYRNTSIFVESSLSLGTQDVRAIVGYDNKLFGAESFYVDNWASREHTRTGFINLKSSFKTNRGRTLNADVYHRRHRDRFLCDVLNPSVCNNSHLTEKSGSELLYSFPLSSGRGSLNAGLQVENDRIISSNMGNHSRDRASLYVHRSETVSERMRLDAGVRADKCTEYDYNWSWTLGMSYMTGLHTNISTSFGKSFRLPTFTELFYSDPAHVSNSNLAPEDSYSGEVAMKYVQGAFVLESTVFRRVVDSLIDWTRTDPAASWKIRNNGSGRFSGISNSIIYNINDSLYWTLSHDYLRVAMGDNLEYKYAASMPENQLRLGMTWQAAGGISFDVRTRYEKLPVGRSVSLADIKITKRKKKDECYLMIRNLFNRQYEDVAGAPMPGFSAETGIRWRFTPAR